MKEQYFAFIKFPLLVSLMLLLILALFFTTALVRYDRLGPGVWETAVYIVVFVFLTILISSWLLVLLATHQKLKPRWFVSYAKWMLFNVYYFLARFLGGIGFQSKKKLQESFLHFNNELIVSNFGSVDSKNILILLPHCLQNSACKIRITSEVTECEDCGQCDMTALKKTVLDHRIKSAIATGGSLARKILSEYRPDIVIAVACHRDLTDGVRECWRFPVFGILNERPQGPCHDTRVNLSIVNFAIKKFSVKQA
ncbi:MAG: DUF116 domain-containing protein [Candidatus Cloacimonetes bacterium]|nr:DUF116 domain-containing protein [Candidatus Cloacimonadota bacterium]